MLFRSSVVQERYITLSVHRKTVEEGRTFFERMTVDVALAIELFTEGRLK